MNYFLILSVFLAVVFAASDSAGPAAPVTPFAELAPKDAKQLKEFNKTVKAVTEKAEAITACKAMADLATFKTCMAKITELPKLFVDNFPEKYNEEKSVEEAMKAYTAALAKPADKEVKLSENEKEKEKKTFLDKAADVMFYIMYAAVSVFVIAGFIMIVYSYFVKKSEGSDL